MQEEECLNVEARRKRERFLGVADIGDTRLSTKYQCDNSQGNQSGNAEKKLREESLLSEQNSFRSLRSNDKKKKDGVGNLMYIKRLKEIHRN